MKFRLEIKLGNDTMQTYEDINALLRAVFKRWDMEDPPKLGESRRLRDLNGNTVGRWEIEEE